MNTPTSSIRLLVAIVATSSIAFVGTNVMPVLLGSLMDGLHLDAARAGALGSAELIAVALGSFALSSKIATVSRRAVALSGACVVALGYLLSALATGYGLLLASRILVGAGAGTALAASNATVAASERPDELYAKVVICGGTIGALLVASLPVIARPLGFKGAFAVICLLVVLALPLVKTLPRGVRAGRALGRGRFPQRKRALALLAAILLSATSEAALWAFAQRIGLAAEVEPETVGLVLGLTMLMGLAGAGIAAWLGTRFGRSGPMTLGLLASAVMRWLVVQASTPAEYLLTQVAWGMAFFFTLPYLLGAAAALDSLGRWSAAGGAVSTLGYGLGPGIAGLIVARVGYPALGCFVFTASLAALGLALPAVWAMDRPVPRPCPVPGFDEAP
ncbi:MAG: MFS transporter [Candidatus Binatia bacterium]